MHPRLVKEADTLSEAGYEVRVCASQFVEWATEADQAILSRAGWQADLLCLKFNKKPHLLWKSRIRQQFFRTVAKLFFPCVRSKFFERIIWSAYDGTLPELLDLVVAEPADLFIAHDLRALPIAVTAAHQFGTRAGFDAEDFCSGKKRLEKTPEFIRVLKEHIERRYLNQCDYVTAGSPNIAEVYAAKYGIRRPVSILNVFPLSQRPKEFRTGTGNNPLNLYWFSQTIGAGRGLEDVVRAMGILRGYPIHLHLRGSWQNGYRDKLFRLATEVGLSSKEISVHPPGPPDEMVRLANQYEIGLAVEPGLSENNQIALSNKLFTYLLAGNAVIATATKGQQPVIKNLGLAAYGYKPGDVEALAGRLKLWHDHRELLEASRRQAWDWGTRQYNWDLEKNKFLRVVNEVLMVDQTTEPKDRIVVG